MSKVVFFDMDGTLLAQSDPTSIPCMSEYTKEILKEVRKQGHHLFIASGRPYAFLPEEVLEGYFDGFVLANGSCILFQGESLYLQPLDAKRVKALVEEFDRRKIDYVLQGKIKSYIVNHTGVLKEFYTHCNVNFNYIVDHFDLDKAIKETVKIEVMPTTKEDEMYCLNLKDDYFNLMGEPPYALEIYSKLNSKASGIEMVLKQLKIDRKESYAFGDGMNDIEMLEHVGHSFAMDNASDEVKKHANEVCLSACDDGVAKKLKELFLGG